MRPSRRTKAYFGSFPGEGSWSRVTGQRGSFITVEGGEGVGKSRLIQGVVAEWRRLGRDVVKTREPGGTPSADHIRRLFGSAVASEPWLAITEALLVSAARAQHVGYLVRPALEQGRDVVCDRYVDSMRVYQGVVAGLPAVELESVTKLATGGLEPDVTLLLDCPVEVSLTRLKARGAENGAQCEDVARYDRQAPAFHESVRQGFLSLAARYPKRFVVLDGTLSAEAVLALALTAVQRRLQHGG